MAMNTIQRAYKYRFYPTPEQEQKLAKMFGCVRFIYNWGLKLRTDAFYERQERVGYNDTAKLLTQLKKQPETEWLNEVSIVCLQQSLRNLDSAFKNFFQKIGKYPTFKKKHDKQSARYTTSGFRIKEGEVWLAKMNAPLNIRWSRKFTGEPSSVTVSKDSANRYFISILVEENIELLPVSAKNVGIDLGLTHAAILSDGSKIVNPKFLRQSEKKLAKAQRQLSRKVKGSKNRAKARYKVAKIHAKIGDQRRDWQNKLTTKIVHDNQVIAVESLRVKNMVKNRCLAKAISDVGWGEMVRQIEYKSNWYGRTFVKIDQWYPSSKRCSGCGYTMPKLSLKIRSWDCPSCKVSHDRDLNASKNILAAGLAILAGADKIRIHE